MPIFQKGALYMEFTTGKRRIYERLMKEKPGFTHGEPSEEAERPLRQQAKGVVTKPKQTKGKGRRED